MNLFADDQRSIFIENTDYKTKFCSSAVFGSLITAGWQLLKNRNVVPELNKKAIISLIGWVVLGGTWAGISRLSWEAIKRTIWKYVSYDDFLNWLSDNQQRLVVKTVIIPNSVTSIGMWTFHNCSMLTNVTIPNSVTSIGYAAFYECKNLTEINIPNSVTSIDQIAFYSCFSLTSVNIPNSVTSISNLAFENCKNLNSVTFKGNKPKIGQNAFRDSSITQIFVQNPNEWSRQDLENMGLDPDKVQIKKIWG